MVLKAIGKCIDTLPIRALLTQEEHLADTVTFEADRFYNGHDLAKFTFFLRGVTPSGGETQCGLEVIAETETVQLSWHVDSGFTAEAGELALDLYGVCYAPTADPSADLPDAIIRFQLPAVQVRALPLGGNTLDSHSYTEFLLEVRAAANDAVAALEQMTAELDEEYGSFAERLAALEARLTVLEHKLADHENRLAVLEG